MLVGNKLCHVQLMVSQSIVISCVKKRKRNDFTNKKGLRSK